MLPGRPSFTGTKEGAAPYMPPLPAGRPRWRGPLAFTDAARPLVSMERGSGQQKRAALYQSRPKEHSHISLTV